MASVSQSQFRFLSWLTPRDRSLADARARAERLVRAAFVIGCGAASLWVAAYLLLRTVQPYPLDAFEEYQLQKATRWAAGASLYGPPADELEPEAYPPLYFWLLGIWAKCCGESFVTQRALSLVALGGMIGCGWWAFGDAADRRLARIAFVATLFSWHALSAKFYEVGKPDTLLACFVALAIVAGEHRSWPEVIASSVALWLASLTKQNGPLFVLPICLSHVLNGRWRWAAGWGAAMTLWIGGSYWLLDRWHDGNFSYWVFRWTAGHGVDFMQGIDRTLRAIVVRAPVLFAALAGSVILRPRSRWTWCLAASLAVGVMGMSKTGGIANHLMPAAFVGAVIVAEWLAGCFRCAHKPDAQARGDLDAADPSLALRAGVECSIAGTEEPSLTRRVRVPGWLARSAAFAVLAAVVWPGLPGRRDFRWIGQRAAEVADWAEAVRQLDGRVAVSHHWLLARQAGANCFFSDLILRFPGLVVLVGVQERIHEQEFDYLVLVTDPRESPTPGWAQLISANYEAVGDLDFRSRSDLLPRRLYKARRASAGPAIPDQPRSGESQ